MDYQEEKIKLRDDYEKRFEKVRRTEGLARTFTKYALTKEGYHSVSLESKRGYESKGIVDVVAVKKLHKEDSDKMEIVLLQRKGNIKVTKRELKRLKRAVKIATIKYGIAEYREGKMTKVTIFDT